MIIIFTKVTNIYTLYHVFTCNTEMVNMNEEPKQKAKRKSDGKPKRLWSANMTEREREEQH